MRTKCWSENLKGRDHSEDRLRWEDKIRMDLKEIGWKRVDWMHLAQDKDQWWAPVNAVMTFGIHKRRGI
jgi:hypothetical protein